MFKEDIVYCMNCHIKKYRAYIPKKNGLDMETLAHETKTAKCCEDPFYLWVCRQCHPGDKNE